MEFIGGLALGGNSKCIKMLQAFQQFIEDYPMPADKMWQEDLVHTVWQYEEFLYYSQASTRVDIGAASSAPV